MPLGEICEYWARWRPGHDAIRCGEQRVTWSELHQRVEALAAGLSERGIGAGDRVGIFATNSIEWCELTLATLRCGGVTVPLNVRLSAPELSYAVSNSDCAAVAYDTALAPTCAAIVAELPSVLTIGIGGARAACAIDDLREAKGAVPAAPVDSDDPAVIAYTSGTTGRPRGAMLSHANISASAAQWGHPLGWTSDTAFLLVAPLAFTGGIISNFMSAYCVGGLLVLEREFAPDRALRLLAETPINTMFGVPVLWQAIAAEPEFADADLTPLTGAVTGGAPVPASLLDTYLAKGVTLRQAYACTEACSSAVLPVDDVAVNKLHSAGSPMLHTHIRVLGEDGRDLPAGEVGQIAISGPQVMKGYWNDPERTAGALVDGWLRTGDLGRLDDAGDLAIVDRKNDMIISGGLNVYPAEIELAITDLDGVVEVAAFGVPHDRWGETVAIVVVGAVAEDALLDHCRTQLADYKNPRFVSIRDEPLPRSMSGKILRRELRDAFDPSTASRTALT